MKISIIFVITLLLLNPFISLSQELGSHLLKNYSPEEYYSHSQNWAIIQDNRGIMYFGNTECIVEYDGTFWNKIPSSNNTIIRSFALGNDGVIYVGAVGDFGYLAADSIGKTSFYSLTTRLDSIDKDFNDVWETVSTNSGIYFRSMKKLFRYNPENDELKVWTSTSPLFFNPSFSMKSLENDFILRTGYQYHNIENNEIVPLPVSKLLSDYFIYKLLPFSKTKFVCIAYNQIFIFDTENNEEPASIFSEKLTDEFSDANLYMGTTINDQMFVVSSRDKGAYLIGKNGEIIEHVDKNSNLQENFIWTSYFSKDSILWLGLNDGFSSVEINSPFRIWDENTGFQESINDIIRFNGIIYLATMNGLYFMQKAENGYDKSEIIEISGTNNELWKFCIFYDEKLKKERLLAASTKDLMTIGNRA